MIRNFGQDLKYAARSLRRTPGFTIAAVVTLALGIGANSAIFTLLDAVVLKPLPLPQTDELVTLYENPTGPDAPISAPDVTGGTGRYLRFSYPRFQRLQRALGDMGSLAAMTRTTSFPMRVTDGGDQTLVRGQLVSGNYFGTAGVAISRGRSLTDEDVRRADAEPVAIVSDKFWKRMFGGSDAAVGRTILISRVPVTIIGIAPPGFVGMWSDNEPDIWMPLTMQPALGYRSNASGYGGVDLARPWVEQDRLAWLNLVGRVRPEQRARAEATLKAVNRDALVDMSLEVPDPRERPSITSARLVIEPFVRGFSLVRGRLSTSLLALAGMVAVVLLIACANIANLLVARSTARAREIGIRISLGASRLRLIQQGLAESLLLAAIGGAAGFLAGQWTSTLLARAFLGSFNAPLPSVFDSDLRVLSFTAGTTLLTALLFGLLPSIRASRTDVSRGLGLVSTRGVIAGSTLRGMRPLVAAQLALSLMVVFAAGLLGRTLVNFSRIDPGFSIDHVVAIGFAPRLSGYTIEQLPALRDRLVAIARDVPGVASSTLSSCGLMANCVQSGGIRLNPTAPPTQLNMNYVGAGFFETVGIPLIEGRGIMDRDVDGSPRVAVVSESVAKRYPAGSSVIGQEIGDGRDAAQIVGVVRDTRPLSLREAPVPMVYFALAQSEQVTFTLTARVTGDADAMAVAIRQALRKAEPALITDTANTMETYLAQAISRERLVTYLVTALGAVALLLGCVGLYGVLSYAVARRMPELGVRVALGATPRNLRDIVLRDAVQVIVGGSVIGLAGAYWANRLIQSLLFEVGAFDPLTGLVVVLLLAGSALAACSIPARRAARVDPIQALRAD